MNNFRKRLKRKALRKNLEIKEAINSFIQPYKEMPSDNNPSQGSTDRMNPHDLFSQYTADIIREDIMFTR